jgi:hypothetical protein
MRTWVASHQFYFALRGTCEPIDLNTYTTPSVTPRRNEYLCQVLRALREYLPDVPLRFYVTDSWKELPSYGRNVYAILRDCGAYYFPEYADEVGGVFKVHPLLPYASFGSGSLRLELSTALRFAKDAVVWANTYMNYLLRRRGKTSRHVPKIHSIPLGYGRQKNVLTDLDEPRRYDLSFSGSVASRESFGLSLKGAMGAPKTLSRRRMIVAARELQRRRPDLRIALRFTGDFSGSLADDGTEYSRTLAMSKIALVPRGDVFESFRYFEAMRSGCAVVCEPQPALWFYKNSPAVVLRDWSHLGDVVSTLLATPGMVGQLQSASLDHWNDVCSEKAVARFMAERIVRDVQEDR